VLSGKGASTAGRLRHRLVLERDLGVSDSEGGATSAWMPVASLFADIVPLAAEERVAGEALASRATHRIVIRHRGDVAGGDRFRLGSRLFDIDAVYDPHEDGRWLVCLVNERAAP